MTGKEERRQNAREITKGNVRLDQTTVSGDSRVKIICACTLDFS